MDPVCKVLNVLFETVLGLGTKNENSSWLLTFSEGLFDSTPTSTKKRRWEPIKGMVHNSCCSYAWEIYLFLIIGLLHVQ